MKTDKLSRKEYEILKVIKSCREQGGWAYLNQLSPECQIGRHGSSFKYIDRALGDCREPIIDLYGKKLVVGPCEQAVGWLVRAGGGKKAILEVAQWIYEDGSDLYLRRKYEKMQSIVC